MTVQDFPAFLSNVDLQCGAILDFISNLQSAVFKARKDKRRVKQISSNECLGTKFDCN